MGPISCGVELFLESAPDGNTFDKERELARSRKSCNAILHAMVLINELYYKTYPKTPWLFESPVIYQEEPPMQESFDSVPVVLKRGWGDCDDLCAWRVAELNLAGIRARPYIKWRVSGPNQHVYHAVVQWPDGRIEDPSLALGMGGAPVTREMCFIDPGPMPKVIDL